MAASVAASTYRLEAANPRNFVRANPQRPRETKNIRLFDYANLSLDTRRAPQYGMRTQNGLQRGFVARTRFTGSDPHAPPVSRGE